MTTCQHGTVVDNRNCPECDAEATEDERDSLREALILMTKDRDKYRRECVDQQPVIDALQFSNTQVGRERDRAYEALKEYWPRCYRCNDFATRLLPRGSHWWFCNTHDISHNTQDTRSEEIVDAPHRDVLQEMLEAARETR